MPVWATVLVTLGVAALVITGTLLGAQRQHKSAESRRRDELREQHTRDGATIIVSVLELLSAAHPDRLGLNAAPDNAYAGLSFVWERWDDLRPSLRSFAFAHPAPEMQQLGESLTAEVSGLLNRSAVLVDAQAHGHATAEDRHEALQQHSRASELARKMMDAARAVDELRDPGISG